MNPRLFFILSIGVNILIIHYLIKFYYIPIMLADSQKLQDIQTNKI